MSADTEGATNGLGSVVVIGFPYVIAKHTYLPAELARLGLTHVFYIPPADADTLPVEPPSGVVIEYGKAPLLKDLLAFARVLRRWRPRHVQVSFNARRVTPYTFIAWAFGFRTLVWCQGGEIQYWDTLSGPRRILFKIIFRRSRGVVVNELYMTDVIRERGIVRPERLAFFHSSIPTTSDGSPERTGKIALFLNSFKHWRHPELLIEATPEILARVPDAQIVMVGETDVRSEVQGKVHWLIEDLGLAGHVATFPFTDKARQYFDDASVFVLPADIVFCNFALLEAMDRYVVPVVADVSGAERIVVDGVNGFLASQTPDGIAKAVVRVLLDEDLRRRLAKAAHDKIAESYDVASMAPEVLRLYAERVWR